jgi:hypothetical protein
MSRFTVAAVCSLTLFSVAALAPRAHAQRHREWQQWYAKNSPASTSVTCTRSSGAFTLPVAAGTVVATCTVAPTTWLGTLAVSGNSAFGMNGSQVVVGSGGYDTTGSVSLTVTATP